MDLPISTAWLYGGTGQAFILNVSKDLDPATAFSWNHEILYRLSANLGLQSTRVFAVQEGNNAFSGNRDPKYVPNCHCGCVPNKKTPSLGTRQDSPLKGNPCLGWHLDFPEFYLITGYDSTGYFYSGSGPIATGGPKPWEELGETHIGVLELVALEDNVVRNDRRTVMEAFSFAIRHAENPPEWLHPSEGAGIKGYTNWIQGLHSDSPPVFGIAYHAAIWGEARQYAVEFLTEAQNRLHAQYSPLFEEALVHYGIVDSCLSQVSTLFPFPPTGRDTPQSSLDQAKDLLQTAARAKERGLQALAAIVGALEPHVRKSISAGL